MKMAKIMMKAVGMREAKMHHHQTIIFFCCRRSARKKNKKENLTLTMAMPRSDVTASSSFSPSMSNGMKFAGALSKPASTFSSK